MVDSVQFHISGLQELEKRMRELGPDVARKSLRSAVAAGASILRREIRARAPVESGTLRRAVFTKYDRGESQPGVQATYIVGVRRGKKEQEKNRDAYYWSYVEFGHGGPHAAPAHPFVRPAFDASKDAITARIREKLLQRIEHAAAQR